MNSILFIIYKNNSKWMTDLNIKPKTITLPEENIEKNLHVWITNDFLHITAKE